MSCANDSVSQSDIAIIGMALRVPGARNIDEFWRNLREGVESIVDRSPEELLAAGESPELLRRKNYVPRTAPLPGLDQFDADFFGFSPKEAAIMDPQHRQFLECAWEAFEHAGRPPATVNGPVGVFAGCGMGSYFYFNVCSHRSLVEKTGMFLLRHTGNDKDFLATRASYLFDLHGPSVNIQTACSTSLVAVHYACQSLLSGECEMAIAGGVTIELPHNRGYLFQEGEILSTDGHCRAFDHRASGTVFGSGVGVVVLRRLQDAIADGDHIEAVIKATAINNDGASKAGYLAPSVTGQAEAVVEAQTLAGIEADSVGYVECHGTGTYLGDPIEIEALTEAFRQTTDKKGFCRVGSVKSNIGHLDTAAGVVSLIKTTLAVKHGEIPPTLGFERPNPAIDFASGPFVVNDRLTPWSSAMTPRRAGVNSLGVGGTNAHIVIEEAPPLAPKPARPHPGPHLLVLSAKNKRALEDARRNLADYLQAYPQVELPDVAYTLLKGRRHFEQRSVIAVTDRDDAIAQLAQPSKRAVTHTPVGEAPKAVFLFPGGGAQYPHMARTLYRDEPEFRRIVDEGLAYLPAEVEQEIRSIWLAEEGPAADAAERLLRPSLQLPALLIIEVAIARLWMSWGIEPAALIGHSMGENAAACVAGVLSFETAVKLVRLRGELFETIPPGGMLSIAITPEALRARLPDHLDIASINAPELCVVSGANDALDAFAAELAAEDIEVSRIPIDIAAHSHMLAPILERFEAFLRAASLAAPRIPIVSNLTGQWLGAEDARDPAYWTRHLRSTVRFADGLSLLAQDASNVYIEVGPGRVLGSLAKAQGTISANQVINSLPHADEASDDRAHFVTALGRAWATGMPVQLDRLWQEDALRRIALPTYPFQHESFFLDRVAPSAEQADDSATPEKIADLANWGWQPTWRQAYPEAASDADEQAGCWLVFLDDEGMGEALAARLRREGHDVATVTAGDAFGVSETGDYVLCPEHGRDGYEALISDLVAKERQPRRIVHLWLATNGDSYRAGSNVFHRNLERGFYSLFFLGQAISNAGVSSPLQISVVTNGTLRVADETLDFPEKATVLGPAQVLPREMPNVAVRVIDLPARQSQTSLLARPRAQLAGLILGQAAGTTVEDTLQEQLWDDLLAADKNEIVAYRKNRRWVRSYAPLALNENLASEISLRERGTYLITGGLGDLACACAEEMARRFRARLILVGRTKLPDRRTWDAYLASYGTADKIGRAIAAIKRIESAGGEVAFVRADITNPEAMRAAIEAGKARFGAINGVLHTAGVVKDELIALKSVDDIEEVFAPKILGTMVLAEAVANEPLDFLVLFSSTSSDTAPAGQVDYVAANAFLNAFAESRAGKAGVPTIAVHWGVWKSIGLAARAIEHAEHQDTPADVTPITSALYHRRVRDAAGKAWLEASLKPSSHWILDEHRLTSGQAVFPGTGYIELIAEAVQTSGLGSGYEITDLTFLQPLYVPDAEQANIRVSLSPAPDGSFDVAIESSPAEADSSGQLRHAEAKVRTSSGRNARRIDVEGIRSNCCVRSIVADTAPLPAAQAANLRFGPRWQVLRSIAYGNGEAIAELALAPDYRSDIDNGYALHPALLDIATGYAMELIEGYDPAAGLWVPMSYGSLRVSGVLPDVIWSHARRNTDIKLGPGYATFDVTISDADGHVIVEVEGFTIKHLAAGHDFIASAATSGAAKQAATHQPQTQAELSPALARLAAQVEQGILPKEGFEAMLRAIGSRKPEVVISSMDLARLQRAAAVVESAASPDAGFGRPNLDVEYVEPQTDLEKTLAGFWSELLGVEMIGINDSFFDLGGHSLIAVRLFRMIKKAFAVDLPISALFEAPTIAQCAELITRSGGVTGDDAATDAQGSQASAQGKPRLLHVVRMDANKQATGTPFFICSGMFGNILNLRYLANQISKDRPVYGLQARGIYGGEAPHETFEEMARDYLAEIRTVQPHGPYLLGGFSGGGLVAYEMAQQLQAAGEQTNLVVLLDTPYPDAPTLSIPDRVLMKLQDLMKEREKFLTNWLRRRRDWSRKQRQQAIGLNQHKTAETFHNEEIEAAFRRALSRYTGAPYDEPVLLLRPRLNVAYRITGGRLLNHERGLLRADNGWTPYTKALTILEVPGDHDNMVLEPNVRVTAGHIREALRNADSASFIHSIAAE